ncbi:hypothetical protein SDJN02_04796, partial [Cucurbita argyrosperma subsp. argyrosperma]
MLLQNIRNPNAGVESGISALLKESRAHFTSEEKGRDSEKKVSNSCLKWREKKRKKSRGGGGPIKLQQFPSFQICSFQRSDRKVSANSLGYLKFLRIDIKKLNVILLKY